MGRKRHATDSGDEEDRRRRRDSSPPRRHGKEKPKERSKSPAGGGGSDDVVESMSIEETNKLRAKLGLAPLQLDDGPKERVDESDGLTVVKEDGVYEFKHKPSANWGEKRREQEMREKIEAAKKKRQLQEKLFKGQGGGGKTLADSDSDDDTSNWVSKMRSKAEDERRKAAEREKMLDEMDDEVVKQAAEPAAKPKKPKTKRQQQPRQIDTAGMVIGHSRDAFAEMQDQILVLEDKSVLDEGEETLVNVNMVDDERHARNSELKMRKDPNRNFDEDLDQYGNRRDFGLLSKYDEELEGVERKTFRLDEEGGYDVDKEEREAKIRRDLEMANKKLVSLDMPDKFKMASEFYTQEEMVAFRKPKKVKKEKSMRKRGKLLKADDLVPVETAGGENLGSRDRGRRRRDEDESEHAPAAAEKSSSRQPKREVKDEPDDDVEMEEEEAAAESKPRWKKTMGAAVDLNRLQRLADRESDESDEEFGTVDLSGVVVDDEAGDELNAILEKTRRFKQSELKRDADTAQLVHKMLESYGTAAGDGGGNGEVKMEVESEGEEMEQETAADGVIRMDSTTEYCRNIGENLTYGLAGNRADDIDTTQLKQELEEENDALQKWKEAQEEKKERRKKKKQKEERRGGWTETEAAAAAPGPSTKQEESALDSDDERELEKAKGAEYDSSSDEDGGDRKEYDNVLGREADVSKGVGAMLKLAGQKGYLDDPSKMKKSGQSLDHLRIQAKHQVSSGEYGIEDKYMKKLDRLGTTGRGPVMPFAEKKEYQPDVNIEYVDSKGRPMEKKEAYRELSYKFHGRRPGKKQSEKRMMQREKKELLKQMNSSDTPLGTLSKQLKKQEQLQTPYLVLSGSGRSDHASLKKD